MDCDRTMEIILSSEAHRLGKKVVERLMQAGSGHLMGDALCRLSHFLIPLFMLHGLAAASVAAEQSSVEKAIAELRQKISAVKDIRCSVEERKSATRFADAARKYEMANVVRSGIFMAKSPRKVRQELTSHEGLELTEVRIVNGSVEWTAQHRKDASRVDWGNRRLANMLEPFPALLTSPPAAWFRTVDYLGEEECDGIRCRHFRFRDLGSDFWFSHDTGLVQKISDSVRVTRFEDCTVNSNLADNLFTYVPVAGARVHETTFGKEGEKSADWVAPYPAKAFDEPALIEARRSLQELRKRFFALRDFTAIYHQESLEEHQVSDPVRGLVRPVTVVAGALKVLLPDKIAFTFRSFEKGKNPGPEQWYRFNGKTEWIARAYGPTQPVRLVTQQTRGLLKQRLSVILPKREEQREGMAPSLRDKDLINGSRDSPFLLEIFDLLPKNALKLEGPETLSGENTIRFLAEETAGTRRMRVWFGTVDGVPRKLEEENWRGDGVESRYVISDVKVNAGLKGGDFIFKNDGSYQLMDMDAQMPMMEQMMRNTLNTPPETTFMAYFDTPVNKVRNLKGSGFAWMSFDFFIRFEADAAPEMKGPPEMAAAEVEEARKFFIEHFPEDKAALDDKTSLECKAGARGRTAYWLLTSKRNKVYFFRVRGGE